MKKEEEEEEEDWICRKLGPGRLRTCEHLSWEADSLATRASASKRALSHCNIWLSFEEIKGFDTIISGLVVHWDWTTSRAARCSKLD